MKTNHLLSKVLLTSLFAMSLASCGDVDPTRVTGVVMSEHTHTMEKEDTFKLSAVVQPDTAVNTLVTYSSTDPTVLSVDENGLVTALKDGVASIIVKTNDNGKTDKCDFTIKTSEYILSGDINVKKSFLSYKENRKDTLSDAEQFLVPNLEYKVGSNNAVNLMPDYLVWSEDAQDFVDNIKWKYPHDIKVEILGNDGNYKTADSTYYTIESDRKCDVKFTNNAVGKVFKVSITPGNLSAEFKTKHPNTQTAVYDGLKVVDGYNIYNADELSLIDTNEGEASVWKAFKEAKNIDERLHPTTLVLHNNMQVTKANMPASFFYSGLTGDFAKYNGTLKDYSEIYQHKTGDNLNIYGNYFKLDFSSLPVVQYDEGKAVSDSFVSHATLVTVDNGSATFNDLNLLGNASKSKQLQDGSQDTSGRGGFIFTKGRDLADAVTANNILFRSWFITFMGEEASNSDGFVDFVLNNCKGRDNYNSFLYNWGGRMTCTGCSFKGCGGPIVISDHVGVEGTDFGSEDGMEVKGKPASTTFIDCELVNYVAGTEAWFVQFGATAIVEGIKQMSDLFISKGATYLVAENPQVAGTYIPCASTKATSDATGGLIPYITPNFFNFIAINKSGKAEGMTNYAVHGEVSIINTEKMTNQTFNYSRPNTNKAEEIAELIQLAIKYGLYTAENSSLFAALKDIKDNAGTSVAYDKAICQGIRQINGGALGQSAPVFQCGNNFGVYAGGSDLLDLKTITSTQAAVGADFASYISPSDGVTPLRQDSAALYFNGMMLVFGLTGFNLA